MKKAANDIKRCVACGVCALQCPREAIDIYKGCHAVVDVIKCVGCGIFERAYPAGSVEVLHLTEKAIWKYFRRRSENYGGSGRWRQ